MKWRLLFVVCLINGSLAIGWQSPKPIIRFFNDSARYANFYIDGKLGCFVPANPKESNAWCDAEASVGKHNVSVKAVKIREQSCELYVTDHGIAAPGAEVHLSKGEFLHCMSFATDK
ncbi:MAG TPA: hypothetical protein VMP68_10855 [Candidatus Eisenbacteria bacterium]|nr:hypothetical protein [Candidatus Eisenbacteria bacterium]